MRFTVQSNPVGTCSCTFMIWEFGVWQHDVVLKSCKSLATFSALTRTPGVVCAIERNVESAVFDASLSYIILNMALEFWEWKDSMYLPVLINYQVDLFSLLHYVCGMVVKKDCKQTYVKYGQTKSHATKTLILQLCAQDVRFLPWTVKLSGHSLNTEHRHWGHLCPLAYIEFLTMLTLNGLLET